MRYLTQAELSAARASALADPNVRTASFGWLAEASRQSESGDFENYYSAPLSDDVRRELADTAMRLAPRYGSFQRELADMVHVMVPFHQELHRQLAGVATALAPVMAVQRQLIDAARILVPLHARLQREIAEAARILAPVSADLQRQIAALVAASIQIGEPTSRVPNARPRTPEEITAYVNLCATLVTLLIAILQMCATQNQQPGGTVNQVIYNSPTYVTNITTVMQPQPPPPAATP